MAEKSHWARGFGNKKESGPEREEMVQNVGKDRSSISERVKVRRDLKKKQLIRMYKKTQAGMPMNDTLCFLGGLVFGLLPLADAELTHSCLQLLAADIIRVLQRVRDEFRLLARR